MINNPNINILVNGNRCKFYYHEGKTYIEAKQDSEYVIEIKNNDYSRAEAVCSVDGLSVMTGKKASENDRGYIVDGYHPIKIEGFRYSDNNVGSFKFELKDNSYAASKGKKTKRNCGVIGIRLFEEKKETVFIPSIWIETPKPYYPWDHPWKPYWGKDYTWTDSTSEFIMGDNIKKQSDDLNNITYHNTSCNNVNECDSILRSSTEKEPSKSAYMSSIKPKGFDMGTAWGSNKESKVTTVSFNRGNLVHSLDIYYASRESLIEMGVPINNTTKVPTPKSFPAGYAEPPKGWRG